MRHEVTGPPSGVRASGGVVALVVELLSCHVTLPDSAPVASCGCCSQTVRVLELFIALTSVRIGGAKASASDGDIPEQE